MCYGPGGNPVANIAHSEERRRKFPPKCRNPSRNSSRKACLKIVLKIGPAIIAKPLKARELSFEARLLSKDLERIDFRVARPITPSSDHCGQLSGIPFDISCASLAREPGKGLLSPMNRAEFTAISEKTADIPRDFETSAGRSMKNHREAARRIRNQNLTADRR